MNSKKKIVFSAVQPSGDLTLANYAGSICHWKNMQSKNTCFFCIADLHSMTVRGESAVLRSKILDLLALYLSFGIDPKKSVIFVQSSVYEHSVLNWILGCYSYFGEMTRMTQFKSKSIFCKNSSNLGLLNYPVLMASDILLYQTNLVLVGKDQLQHLELAKKIAHRVNSLYKLVFTIPQKLVYTVGSKIMSLLDPTKKMSKSDADKKNCIFFLEKIDSIAKKIRCSVTDSDWPPRIFYDKVKKPGISNLLEILAVVTKKKICDIELEYNGKNYSIFKDYVIDEVVSFISRIQKKFFFYRQEESFLVEISKKGAEKAKFFASKTIKKVYEIFGISAFI